ncbi:class I SAM-dependent methyltransferase [Jiangella ureilytica]|uniref:Class I SAM-dependent methyltransferase n=1 Tax=Jiangella ureilytica TaxID=2530374 RepID=A0A4V2XWX0_9ACTN|nr:class I SAM-dependent methyltransferase [Jiangella ureilytica]TDC50975.1 class I SAM-dependent methyltransferase [Jiangella ureilytica]
MTTDLSPRTAVFGRLRIDYDPRVLRPRAWTAAQSVWAAELLHDAPPGPVLELCAGAGQIGLLAIALAGCGRDLVLVDRDDAACGFARVNAERARPAGAVDVRFSPLETALAPHERFALVIADPPWVPTASIGRFPEDPATAIDGGPDGLQVAWSCIDVIARHLLPGGSAVVQLGTPAQLDRVAQRLARPARGAGDPAAALRVVAQRSYGDRGVLALLRHA